MFTASTQPTPQSKLSKAARIAIIVSVPVAIILLVFLSYWIVIRRQKRRRTTNEDLELERKLAGENRSIQRSAIKSITKTPGTQTQSMGKEEHYKDQSERLMKTTNGKERRDTMFRDV